MAKKKKSSANEPSMSVDQLGENTAYSGAGESAGGNQGRQSQNKAKKNKNG